MSVRKIGKSWWVDFRYDRIRYRKRSPENSKAGALAYEALLRQNLRMGESSNPCPPEEKKYPLFKEFAWEWFEIYAVPNNKPSEISNKENHLRAHLIPFFGKTRIDKISSLQIEKYKAKKTKTSLSNKSINNHLTTLSTCLRMARDWLDFDKLPSIKKLKVESYRLDFLSKEESRKLLAHAKGIWRDVFLVALKTGMRRGELLALSWEDINWEKGKLR